MTLSLLKLVTPKILLKFDKLCNILWVFSWFFCKIHTFILSVDLLRWLTLIHLNAVKTELVKDIGLNFFYTKIIKLSKTMQVIGINGEGSPF